MPTFKDLCLFSFLSLLCAFGEKQLWTGNKCWHCQCLRLVEEKRWAGGTGGRWGWDRAGKSQQQNNFFLCPTWIWCRQRGCCGSPWALGFGVTSSLGFSWQLRPHSSGACSSSLAPCPAELFYTHFSEPTVWWDHKILDEWTLLSSLIALQLLDLNYLF